jgi:hypothetical protein
MKATPDWLVLQQLGPHRPTLRIVHVDVSASKSAHARSWAKSRAVRTWTAAAEEIGLNRPKPHDWLAWF